MTDGRCQFLPWVRQGFEPDQFETPESIPTDVSVPNTEVSVNIQASGRGASTTHTTDSLTFDIYGPGEVQGIDRQEVVRTEPANLTTEFPPNYFPLVEFNRPDFLWLFSPRKATTTGQLRPWICLVVVRKQDGVELSQTGTTPQPVLEIGPPAVPSDELPDLIESWAWAHAQIVGKAKTLADSTCVKKELEKPRSNVTVSRLIAPRRLTPDESYYACVVPTYEAGRRVGLGQDPPSGNPQGGAFSWSIADNPTQVRLPVYYYWEFGTGPAGDFEALARALTPQPLPETVGYRELDVTDPGPSALETATPETVTVSGALRSPPPDDAPVKSYSKADDLAALLDRVKAAGAPGISVIGPSKYGRWYATRSTIPLADETPAWFRELNVDPRHRVVAALGTRVAQDQQEQLLASAWAQFGELQEANQLLRSAQLARESTGQSYRYLDAKDDTAPTVDATASFLLTEPLHGRVVVESGPDNERATVNHHVERSRLPRRVLSPAFRRALRPNGPIARRFVDQYDDWDRERIVGGLNEGSVDVEPTDGGPGGISDLSEDEQTSLCNQVMEVAGGTGTVDEATRDRLDRLNAAAERAIGLRARIGRRAEMEELHRIEVLFEEFREIEERIDGLLDSLELAVENYGHYLLEDQWGQLRGAHSKILSIVSRPQELEELSEILSILIERQEQERDARQAVERLLGADDPILAELARLIELLRSHRNTAWSNLRLVRAALDRENWEGLTDEHGPIAALERRCERATDDIESVQTLLDDWEYRTGEMSAAVEGLAKTVDPDATEEVLGNLRRAIDRGNADEARDLLEGLVEICSDFSERLEHLADLLDIADHVADALRPKYCRTPRQPIEQPSLDIEGIAEGIVTALSPDETVLNYVRSRIDADKAAWSRRDPLDEIVPTPEFPQPMSEPLADLSQDYLLPGVQAVPNDSIGLLETNPEFVAAFEVGLNHEVNRELLYGGVNGSQRGTPARQFWDVRGQVPKPTDEEREQLKDIDPIHTWNPESGLAVNVRASSPAEPTDPSEDGRLVLLVRGELLRRYPTTRIYAVKGKWVERPSPDDSKETIWRRVPLTEEEIAAMTEPAVQPVQDLIFRGTLDPDVTFIGFNLREDDARGVPTVTSEPPDQETAGWFFVLEEPPAEPRFGLDENSDADFGTQPDKWDDLAWEHVLADPDLGKYIPVRDSPDGNRNLDKINDDIEWGKIEWGKNAAHQAVATWQRPVSIAIHADDMLLLPEESS